MFQQNKKVGESSRFEAETTTGKRAENAAFKSKRSATMSPQVSQLVASASKASVGEDEMTPQGSSSAFLWKTKSDPWCVFTVSTWGQLTIRLCGTPLVHSSAINLLNAASKCNDNSELACKHLDVITTVLTHQRYCMFHIWPLKTQQA